MVQRGMRSLALSALVLTVVLAACTHADLLSPNPPTAATYDGVYVSPASAELSTAAPSNTVALAAFPTNNDGKRLYVHNPVVSYSSSATGIATVSGDGIVTAVAPGEAVIAVALTIDG